MYATSRQDVRVADASFRASVFSVSVFAASVFDPAFCDSGFPPSSFCGDSGCLRASGGWWRGRRVVYRDLDLRGGASYGRHPTSAVGAGSDDAGQADAVQRQDAERHGRDQPCGKPPPLASPVDPPWDGLSRPTLRRQAPDLACSERRPSAPRRIGSSTNRQDRAATTMVAATWRTCSVGSGPLCKARGRERDDRVVPQGICRRSAPRSSAAALQPSAGPSQLAGWATAATTMTVATESSTIPPR